MSETGIGSSIALAVVLANATIPNIISATAWGRMNHAVAARAGIAKVILVRDMSPLLRMPTQPGVSS